MNEKVNSESLLLYFITCAFLVQNQYGGNNQNGTQENSEALYLPHY